MNTEALINSEEVEKAFRDSLFLPEEVTGNAAPEGAVIAEGVLTRVGFHPGRLASHRDKVSKWLHSLSPEFQEGAGGGWSFLNACIDANGNQWTDLHLRMDQLFSMGLGLGLVVNLLPRNLWGSLPGGMPYYMVKS